MENIDLFEKIDGYIDFSDFEGQQQIYWYGRESMLLLSMDRPPNKQYIERNLSELYDALDAIGKAETKLLLCVWKEYDEFRSVLKSSSSRARALEFLKVVLSDEGLVKGNSASSYGRITRAALLVRINEMGLEEVTDYFKKMILKYFEDCDWIIADEFSKVNHDEILAMRQYRKRHIPWAFVRSCDVAKTGSKVKIRTLENESGIDFVTGDDIYVMIGIQGEVYYISAEKFEKTYEATEEPFDIFSRMTAFIPEISVLPDGEYTPIDEMARICYPKNTTNIFADKLVRRTKVFPVYDKKNYFLGYPGDYMAVRCDDISDVYIIKRQIFLQTYEEV